jgi:hypothetical protein
MCFAWISEQTAIIKSFICPSNVQLNCFKMLKSTLRFTVNAPTCFGLTKPSSVSLQSELH